jgi:polyphosphate kinase
VDAAPAGKEVTVIIELMARFDEAANTQRATRLQEAGAHVMYGVGVNETHAETHHGRTPGRVQTSPLLLHGTGNHHPDTARAHTDCGLFTCDEAIGEDVHELSLQLTSPTP